MEPSASHTMATKGHHILDKHIKYPSYSKRFVSKTIKHNIPSKCDYSSKHSTPDTCEYVLEEYLCIKNETNLPTEQMYTNCDPMWHQLIVIQSELDRD